MNEAENVKVIVRFRPLNKKEENKDPKNTYFLNIDTLRNLVEMSENKSAVSQFIFDTVFDQNTDQETIFNKVAKNAVEWVCEGYNATIFVYGVTSSGKSYTMFGHENGKDPGIIPKSCDLLFKLVNENEQVVEASMKCSFLEIYQENIRDLLKKSSEKLKIRQSPVLGLYVQGLTERHVYSSQEIMDVIKDGARQRATTATALNSVSSRSHAVLTLNIAQKFADGTESISKLNLIDLAGSENVGRSEAQGVALTEAQTINRSLSCLGNVIYALTEKGRDHIPYRDSKLTFLLQDSLGGNAKTIMIATASPSYLCYSETINTLKFAKRAKEIKNIPKVNRNESTANLLATIEALQKRINELEKACQETHESTKDVIQVVSQENGKEINLLKNRCDRLEKKINSLLEESEKEKERNSKLSEIFEKQRELSQHTAMELYEERNKFCSVSNELEQYKLICESIKDSLGLISPEALEMLVKRYLITGIIPSEN